MRSRPFAAAVLAFLLIAACVYAGVGTSGANFSAGRSNIGSVTAGDWVAPVLTLTAPAANARLDAAGKPTFSGAAGTVTGDSATVVVRIYSGSGTGGTLAQALTTTATGATWSATPTIALPDGTYTAQAEQGDGGGNLGKSAAVTFTVDTAAPAPTVAAPTGSRADAHLLRHGGQRHRRLRHGHRHRHQDGGRACHLLRHAHRHDVERHGPDAERGRLHRHRQPVRRPRPRRHEPGAVLHRRPHRARGHRDRADRGLGDQRVRAGLQRRPRHGHRRHGRRDGPPLRGRRHRRHAAADPRRHRDRLDLVGRLGLVADQQRLHRPGLAERRGREHRHEHRGHVHRRHRLALARSPRPPATRARPRSSPERRATRPATRRASPSRSSAVPAWCRR